MNLEEYKKKVIEALSKTVGETTTLKMVENYEEDLPTYLNENWSPEGTATAILMGD